MTFDRLTVKRRVPLEIGMDADHFIFADAQGRLRSALMLPNDCSDAVGLWGGCMHQWTYETSAGPRVCRARHPFHPGFGYTVNHFAKGSVSSRFFKGSYQDPFIGKHHAFRTYTWRYTINHAPVTATVGWFFVTGRNHVIYAISYDLSEASADKLTADTRAPYGDIAWDGGAEADVCGLGWGDTYVFRTLGHKVTQQSGWSYDERNVTCVPHVLAWTNTPDAEMGLVQTETYQRHHAGGYDGWRLWGQRSVRGPLPDPTVWPFQLNQYELHKTHASKRMAWGSTYGALGHKHAPTYGLITTQPGWPYVSYSTFIVFGEHSQQPTWSQCVEVDTQQRSALSVHAGGQVLKEASAGVGRHDKRVLPTPGFDPVWSVWWVSMDANATTLSWSLAVPHNEALQSVVFAIENFDGAQLPRVTQDGEPLREDEGVLISLNTSQRVLFVTVPGVWLGSHTLTLTCSEEP